MKIVKRFLRRIVHIEAVNALLRSLLRPFRLVIPKSITSRVPLVGVVCVQLPNSKELRLRVDGTDPIASRVYWWGIDAYEGDTFDLFFNLIRDVEVFFDVGASIGIYSLVAAISNPNVEVYAFEPEPKVFDCLSKNIEINKLDNVQLNCSAITSYDGDIALYLTPGASATTLRGLKIAADKVISVPALTLDSFISENSITRVDLMKIDTEATEPQILEGAKELIARDRPMMICEVLHGYTERALQDLLDGMDYRYFWISSEGLVEKKQIEGDDTWRNLNYLFITEERMKDVLKRADIRVVYA